MMTFMMKMDADMVVMTMPDLENYYIKRSLVRKDIEYLYLDHAMASFHLTLREGALEMCIRDRAMTAQLENFKLSYPEAYEKNLRGVPMGRFGDPELDIGRVCVQLGSPDFKYMSGETLTLEGGMGQRP